MKTTGLKIWGIIIALILFSCSKSDDNSVAPEEIGLETQDVNSFAGKTQINNRNLVYDVNSKEENIYAINLKIDEKLLVASISFTDEHIDFNSGNIELTPEEREILLLLGEEISAYLFQEKTTDDFSMAEYTLLRLLEYWGKSPEGYVHTTRSTKPLIDTANPGAKNLQNEGITCIRKNTFINAEYDTADGTEIVERLQVNSDDCLGRCGSGCGSFFSLASAWTKDCFDHDQCGRTLGGSTNPLDVNCGDEYRDAADDYLFGVFRGCSG